MPSQWMVGWKSLVVASSLSIIPFSAPRSSSSPLVSPCQKTPQLSEENPCLLARFASQEEYSREDFLSEFSSYPSPMQTVTFLCSRKHLLPDHPV